MRFGKRRGLVPMEFLIYYVIGFFVLVGIGWGLFSVYGKGQGGLEFLKNLVGFG